MATKASDQEAQPLPPGVLVTGAATGVGRRVVAMLVRAGYRVVGSTDAGTRGAVLIRQAGGIPAYPDLTRPGEIRSVLSLIRAEVVVHAAPQTLNQLPQVSAPDKALRDRLAAETATLVSVAGQMGVRRIIYPSFSFVYGDAGEQPLDESAPLSHDNSLYAAAADAEEAVQDGGVPGVVLRAGFVYGSEAEGMRALRDHLLRGRPLFPGTGLRAWLHEDDLAEVIVRFVQREGDATTAEVFNVADDTPMSVDAFSDAFGAAFGTGTPARSSGNVLTTLLRGADPVHQALLNHSAPLATSKLKAHLDWQPRHAHSRSGFEQTLLTWRASDDLSAAHTVRETAPVSQPQETET